MTLPRAILRIASAFLVLLILLLATPDAKTQTQSPALNITACSAGCAALVYGVGIGVVGTILYFSLRAPRTTGCVVDTGAGGLSLRTDDGTETFLLEGVPATVKPGERIKVLGRKKKNAAKQREIVVSKVLNDYGSSCKVVPAPAT
jgi:hypothetical protein